MKKSGIQEGIIRERMGGKEVGPSAYLCGLGVSAFCAFNAEARRHAEGHIKSKELTQILQKTLQERLVQDHLIDRRVAFS